MQSRRSHLANARLRMPLAVTEPKNKVVNPPMTEEGAAATMALIFPVIPIKMRMAAHMYSNWSKALEARL